MIQISIQQSNSVRLWLFFKGLGWGCGDQLVVGQFSCLIFFFIWPASVQVRQQYLPHLEHKPLETTSLQSVCDDVSSQSTSVCSSAGLTVSVLPDSVLVESEKDKPG